MRKALCLGLFLCLVVLPAAAQEAPVAKAAAQKKLLLIGIDGLRPDAIPAALDAVNLHALIKDGAFAPKSDVLGDRVKGGWTLTGPGWCSVFTGVWLDKHGIKDNTLKTINLKEYPTFFRRIKEARPKATMAAMLTWLPFAEDVFSLADGRRFLIDGDKNGYEEGDRRVTKAAIKLFEEENPDVVFLYYGSVDSHGHGYGFHPKSPRYTKGIEIVDEQLGRVLAALKKRPTYANEDWLIMVCTDHGGKGREHGFGEKDPETRTGFIILNGPSVKKGVIAERVFNVDVAATALAHFGIPIQADWKLDGKVIGLEAAR